MKTSEVAYKVSLLLDHMEKDKEFSDLTPDDRACILSAALQVQQVHLMSCLQMKSMQEAMRINLENLKNPPR